eukprot:68301_1
MLSKLIKTAPKQTPTVPNWLIGIWKREYIFDSDGTMDEYCDGTKVVYIQTPSVYIDFRTPNSIISAHSSFITTGQTLSKPFNNYSHELFNTLATQLCDSGTCFVSYQEKLNDIKVAELVHQGHNIFSLEQANNVKDFFSFPVAKWVADLNYQLNTSYPEPGILTQHESRKDCLYEQPPSNEYLELWQYQQGSNGLCIYLELLKETFIGDDEDIKRENGRMIVMGNYVMMVRDRKQNKQQLMTEFAVDNVPQNTNNDDLQSVIKGINNIEFSKAILDTEYSFGNLVNHDNKMDFNNLDPIHSLEFEIELSSIPFYVGRKIKLFDDANWSAVNDTVLIEKDEEMQLKRYWELRHFDMNKNAIFAA